MNLLSHFVYWINLVIVAPLTVVMHLCLPLLV